MAALSGHSNCSGSRNRIEPQLMRGWQPGEEGSGVAYSDKPQMSMAGQSEGEEDQRSEGALGVSGQFRVCASFLELPEAGWEAWGW